MLTAASKADIMSDLQAFNAKLQGISDPSPKTAQVDVVDWLAEPLFFSLGYTVSPNPDLGDPLVGKYQTNPVAICNDYRGKVLAFTGDATGDLSHLCFPLDEGQIWPIFCSDTFRKKSLS